ncbi:NmrA domain-containing protein [Favolaschia claudopus]|uniref:NmrA domain-containing protein n=1 Tax=Favolaschia claudopus TaxID=2862362 RepID=A0AAW0AW00_9AGAR
MPIITIFGATGNQGSAVLQAVLASGTHTPRAVSRSLETSASKALIAKGIEVVVGNLWDKESVKKAIRGSDVVFGTTNFWDPEVFPADPQGKGEITQGKNLVDAAREEGVKFFIHSSLPNVSEDSKGQFTHVYHCDNKAAIENHLKASGVPFAVLLTGYFPENLYNYGLMEKTSTGFRIPIPKYGPNDNQEFTWVGHDLGQAAVALLSNYQDSKKGKDILGKRFPVVSFKATHTELAAAIAKGINKDVKFVQTETAGLQEFDEMYEYQAKSGMYSDTPVPNPDLLALGVKFGTLEEFVRKEIVPRFL